MEIDQIQLPSDFSTVTDDQLTELHQVAFAAAQPLADRVGQGEDLNDGELATLERLSEVVTGVAGERERRAADEEGAAARASRASAAAAAFATAPTQPDPAPQDPPADPAPVPAAAPSVSAVAAAGGPGPAAAGPNIREGRNSYTRAVAATGAPGRRPGEDFANIGEMAVALEEAMAAFGDLGPGVVQRTNVIQLRREYPPELKITANDTNDQVLQKLDAAGKEPSGGLVAAAGWCAPSEIAYDLFELENGTDGIIDLPELQIRRGGVQVTPGPDFSSIWGGAGYWHQTEAQVIAATSKPTMSIACPTFTDNRLEVEGVQITGAFLQDRGYPELVARFTRGAMVAHARRLNVFAINKVVNGSTTFDYTNVANLPATTSEYKDLTSLSRMLAIIGTQIIDYKYKYRMPFASTLEVILPYWVLESVRADVQRRTNLPPDTAFNLAESQLTDWFAVRGARLQLVYDWQENLNQGTLLLGGTDTHTTVGQTAGVYTLPTTVYAAMYAAGTWVRGVSDVVRLDTVYDSTNLALNQYIQLFTEDGIQIIKRGFESRLLKLAIDPSGTTSATTNMVTG